MALWQQILQNYPISVVYVALSYPSADSRETRHQTVYLLYTVLFVFHLKSFIYDHVDADLSVIYVVHYSCHGSPYEPYLENQ